MDEANRRVAAFARRARIAGAAAGAAVAAGAAAMVRSGLQVVDAQAKLAQSLGTTVASVQVLERAGELAGVAMSGIEQATKDLTRRLSQAAAGTGPAADALDRLGLSAAGLLALPLDERVGRINQAIAEFVPAAERAAVADQLFGEEGSIAISRIDTGTLAQATQDVRDFGVAVSEADADRIERTNDALSRLGLIWRGLSNQLAVAAAPALEAAADAMAALARTTGPLGLAIRSLFDNLGRLASYAATFAAVMAGRWVASFAAAALSVRGLATALVVLRGALVRTGIGALVVGAGELVFQFGRLVQGTGGIGQALALLGDVAREVWQRIGLGMEALGLGIMARWADVRAAIAAALQAALVAVTGFANDTLATISGTVAAIRALWAGLPAAIGDVAFQAANALVAGVEAMLAGAARGIDGLFAGLNAGLEALGIERRIALIGDVRLGRIENPFQGSAADAGAAARAAFEAAFQAEPIAAPDLGLAAVAEEARAQAATMRESLAGVARAATAPFASLTALRAAIGAGAAETGTSFGEAGAAALDLEATLDGTTEAASRTAAAGSTAGAALADAAGTAEDAWAATKEAVTGVQEQARESAEGLAQDIVGPIRSALQAGELSWRSFAGAVAGIARNLANRLIEVAFQPIEQALVGALSSLGSGGLAGLFGFARGGAFAGGRELTAFARGGVVTGPTVFPFARGIGLMGEAGPEAILPLSRGRGGRLGVEVSREPAPVAPEPSTRIINVLDPSVVGDYLATPAGERAILNVIRRNRSTLGG